MFIAFIPTFDYEAGGMQLMWGYVLGGIILGFTGCGGEEEIVHVATDWLL